MEFSQGAAAPLVPPNWIRLDVWDLLFVLISYLILFGPCEVAHRLSHDIPCRIQCKSSLGTLWCPRYKLTCHTQMFAEIPVGIAGSSGALVIHVVQQEVPLLLNGGCLRKLGMVMNLPDTDDLLEKPQQAQRPT